MPGAPDTVYGFDGNAGPHGTTDYTLVSQGAVTGSGTAADPLKQVTVYRTGRRRARGHADDDATSTAASSSPCAGSVKNTDTARRALQGLRRGRLLLRRQRPRHRHLHPGPAAVHRRHERRHRQLGRLRRGPGHHARGRAIRRSRTAAPQRGVGQDRRRRGERRTPTFDDTVVGEQVDNAGGVEWDQYATGAGLAASATATFSLVARSAVPSALQINPPNAGVAQGRADQLHRRCLRHQRRAVRGQDDPLRDHRRERDPGRRDGRRRRQRGRSPIRAPTPGADTVVAFLDFNNDGTRQAAEPQASALATFVDNVPPACTVKVSGDRPGGSGGAGKPLVITVNCNEASTVTVQTTLHAAQQPHARAPRSTRRRSPRRRR